MFGSFWGRMVKVAVTLTGRKEPPIDWELNLQAEIAPQVEELLKLLGLAEEELHKYALTHDKKILNDKVGAFSLSLSP
jgi:hypothetical protein